MIKKATAKKKASPKGTKLKSPAGKRAKAHNIGDKSAKLAEVIIDGIQEKKGKNIVQLDLRNISNAVCDFFIICEAESSTQINAIADSVEEIVKKKENERPFHSEGYQNAEWILIDYVTVVVHIFRPDIRKFYNLEGLWADGEVKVIN